MVFLFYTTTSKLNENCNQPFFRFSVRPLRTQIKTFLLKKRSFNNPINTLVINVKVIAFIRYPPEG